MDKAANTEFNTSEQVLSNLHHHMSLTEESSVLILNICDDLCQSANLEEVDKNKVKIVATLTHKLAVSLKEDIVLNVERKISELEELVLIQMRDKITQRNAYETLSAKFEAHNNNIKEQLNQFNTLQFSHINDSTVEKNTDLMKKLNEVQNQTDFLLQKINQLKESNTKNYDTETYIKDIEEKVNFLYKTAHQEDLGEGKDILNTFRLVLQLHNTCKKLFESMGPNSSRGAFVRTLEDIDNLIYNQMFQAFDQIYRDLKNLYGKMKEEVRRMEQ